jgi:hypoxanthine phosphoribosyltransferase
VQIKDKSFELFLPEQQIQDAIDQLSKRLTADYEGKEVIFVGIMNGAFMFVADLLKRIEFPCEVSFVKLASYVGTETSGTVHELVGLVNDLYGKHVIILEDIVDTGLTLDKVFSMIDADAPASLEVATLLYKPSAFKGKHTPKYVGIEIEDAFVVGYGLDYDEFGRNTRNIYKLKSK